MNYEAFLNECYNGIENRTAGMRFIQRFNKVVGNRNVEEALGDGRTIIRLFYSDTTSDVSKSFFFNTKGHLLKLVTWLNQQGIVAEGDAILSVIRAYSMDDILSLDKIANTHFADFSSAISYVDKIGSICLNDYSVDDTLNIKAFITLFWLGISTEEATALKKSDLHHLTDRGNEIYMLTGLANGRTILLTEQQYGILSTYKNSDSCRGLPSGKHIYYKDNEMLLRAKSKDALNQNNIICALKRFNAIAAELGEQRVLISSNLQKNGLFESVFLSEKKYSTITQAFIDMIGCDRMFAFGYKQKYLAWKQKYHTQ